MLLFMLLVQVVSATVYYPPNADWQNGYTNGSGSSGGASDYQYVSMTGVGTERYRVTVALKDLSTIAYLKIDWSSTWNLAYPDTLANVTFGLSTNQMDQWVINTSKINISTGAFSRTNTSLGVGDLFSSYYIKVGANITGVLMAVTPVVTVYCYGITGFNFSNSTTTNITNVDENTATLNTNLWCDPNDAVEVGFWISNQTTNASNFHQNVSAGWYSNGSSPYYSITGLMPGQYYHVRSWTRTNYSFNISATEDYFITKPNAPTGFTVSTHVVTADLSWTNATVGNTTNHSVLIHYSTSPPSASPTPDTWGTFGDNESVYATSTISGLSEDTTYYFVAWTYVNDTGSPLRAIYSDEYATTSGTLSGGNYTIHVRYENESANGNLPVALNQWGIHKFTIYYNDSTDEIKFWNNQTEGPRHSFTSGISNAYFGNNASGNFTFETNKSIQWIYFEWNSSNGSNYQCRRTLIPTSGQRNITFYIRTDLPIYLEYTAVPNNTLIKYTYYFTDNTIYFDVAAGYNPYAFIYVYNSTGVRLTIDSQYFSANNEIYPMLIYEKKYFIGVGCDEYYVDRLGILPTTDDTAPDPITIPATTIIDYAFYDVINLDIGWTNIVGDTGTVYFYYQDTMSGTVAVNFTVYNCTVNSLGVIVRGSPIYWKNVTQSYYNFTFTTADIYTCYWFNISTNHTTWDSIRETGSMFGPYTYYNANITDITSLNDLITKILGNTPFRNLDPKDDRYGQSVSWTAVLVGVIAGIILLSLGQFNAFIGMMGTGIWLCGAPLFISGLPASYIAVGIFLISMSIVFAYVWRQMQ